MTFLNYQIEIWVAVVAAVLVRVKTSISLGFWGALTTTLVGIGAGMVLHKPIANLFGLAGDYEIMFAMIIALTAENLMKGFIDFSQKPDAASKVITAIVTRDPSHLSSKKDQD